MKKVILPLVLAAVLLFPNVNLAFAAPFSTDMTNDVYGVDQGGVVNGIPTPNDTNDGFPDIFDAINLITGGAETSNEAYDNRFVEPDELWKELGDGEALLVGLSAGFSNTLGVYTDLGVGSVQTIVLDQFSGNQLHLGTFADPFPAGMTGVALNQDFGWFLDANQATKYFSQTALNPLQQGTLFDHMVTYDLSDAVGKKFFVQFGVADPVEVTLGVNTFLIGWEDLTYTGGPTLGDDDYDDMVYLVTSVNPSTELVGGELIPIEATSLILAGAQSFSWMIPIVLSVLGIGLFVVSRKSE